MNRPANELVPQHKVLSASDANALMKKLGLTASNLPKIFSTDPQAVALGAKPGDIVEIDRNDFGKKYRYYRQVVEE